MEGGRGFDCVLGDGERLRGRSEVCIFGFEGVLVVDIVADCCNCEAQFYDVEQLFVCKQTRLASRPSTALP